MQQRCFKPSAHPASPNGPEGENPTNPPTNTAILPESDAADLPSAKFADADKTALQTPNKGVERVSKSAGRARAVRKPPTGRIEGDVCSFTLKDGRVVLVDAADSWVLRYCWHPGGYKERYLIRCCRVEGKRKNYYLHREIMGSPPGLTIDHIDGNPLNNRRSNLRIATQAQNVQNRNPLSNTKTGFRGIYRDGNRFPAVVILNGKIIRLGKFKTLAEAVVAVNQARAKYHPHYLRGAVSPPTAPVPSPTPTEAAHV
jgi:hypothetical protein